MVMVMTTWRPECSFICCVRRIVTFKIMILGVNLMWPNLYELIDEAHALESRICKIWFSFFFKIFYSVLNSRELASNLSNFVCLCSHQPNIFDIIVVYVRRLNGFSKDATNTLFKIAIWLQK